MCGGRFSHSINFATFCRQPGQDTSEEVNRRDFSKELDDRERVARDKRGGRSSNRGEF